MALNYLDFKIPGGSLPILSKSAIDPYFQQGPSSSKHYNPPPLIALFLILSSHLRLGLHECLFPTSLPTKTHYLFLDYYIQ